MQLPQHAIKGNFTFGYYEKGRFSKHLSFKNLFPRQVETSLK